MRRWARKKPSKLTQTEFDFLKATCLRFKERERATPASAVAGVTFKTPRTPRRRSERPGHAEGGGYE